MKMKEIEIPRPLDSPVLSCTGVVKYRLFNVAAQLISAHSYGVNSLAFKALLKFKDGYHTQIID